MTIHPLWGKGNGLYRTRSPRKGLEKISLPKAIQYTLSSLPSQLSGLPGLRATIAPPHFEWLAVPAAAFGACESQ